jgi:hypothetical protein
LTVGTGIAAAAQSMREDDVVILNPAEAKRAAEQVQVIARVQRLTSWAKGLGFTSARLLVVIGSLWAYHSIVARNGSLTP